MIRHAILVGLAVVAGEPACGVDSTGGGINAPCTRDKDCNGGLVCRGGVCTDLDAAVGDAASDAGDSGLADAAPGG